MQTGRSSRVGLVAVISLGPAARLSLIAGESASEEASKLPGRERAVVIEELISDRGEGRVLQVPCETR